MLLYGIERTVHSVSKCFLILYKVFLLRKIQTFFTKCFDIFHKS